MVVKAHSVSSGGAGYDYSLGHDNPEILEKNGVIAENGKELQQEFEVYQEKNSRCTNNNINIIISPSPEDVTNLTNEDFRGIANDMMKKMELQDHQYVVVKHTPESGREHLHIYCNRIDKDGKAYKDGQIGLKAHKKAQEICKERGLVSAKDIGRNAQDIKQINLKEIRSQIFTKHQEVMLLNKPKDFKEYIELMKGKGVEIKPTITKQGKIQGFRVEHQGYNLKGTEVHKNMSLNRTGLKTELPLKPSLAKPKDLLKVADVGVSIASVGVKIGVKVVKKVISKGLGY